VTKSPIVPAEAFVEVGVNDGEFEAGDVNETGGLAII
jgi:hypothetical protein